MYELQAEYLEKLEAIAGQIQESEALQQYLEEEEEEHFNALKDEYEPLIGEVYHEVAAKHPLQLIHLEQILLDPAFEGLFLPRILGFSVLRGTIDTNYKYIRPQHHFQDILLNICNSANFDVLKKRIGQTVQVGFSLSSDIWVTNLINSIDNKRVRNYLTGLKVDRLRVLTERKRDYARYERQFHSENYLSVIFPETSAELTIEYPGLQRFMLYRTHHQLDNSSLFPALDAFVSQASIIGTKEHFYFCAVYGAFMDIPAESHEVLVKAFAATRAQLHEADEVLLQFLLDLRNSAEAKFTAASDLRLAAVVDRTANDQLSAYFNTIENIHTNGYTNEPTQAAIRTAYLEQEGLSPFNENIRRTIFEYFSTFVDNLEMSDYTSFFEITKMFSLYMGLFANQQFNQDLKDLSMSYVDKLLKHFTDKRGKDYQDIKKFVSTTFVEFSFLTDKDIVNLFKTRRRRKADTAE